MSQDGKMTKPQQLQPPQLQPQQPMFDISSLLGVVKDIMNDASNDTQGGENIGQMVDKLTDKVFNGLEKSGKPMDEATKNQMKQMSKMVLGSVTEDMVPRDPNFKSKIDLSREEDLVPQKKEFFEDLDSDEEADELAPIAKDLKYQLQVTLEELYTGKMKKLLVNRKRLDKSGKKVVEEKRKIEVAVLPGMSHGQEIRFNKEGDEKYGYRAGDIIITLAANAHPTYERFGKTLCYVKNISLYESYAAALGLINIVIQHLDGTFMVLKVSDKIPLHTKDGARKIRNGGMPVYDRKTNKKEYGDLYLRFNLILPDSFEGDPKLDLIKKLFPVLHTNGDSVIKPGDLSSIGGKSREVLLEEVTLEDMDQLDYDQESDSESESESDYESASE